MDPIQTSHVLLFDNDKVLLVRHEVAAGHLTGTYGIPGGRTDEGESLQKTVIRELAEETGLSVQEKDLQEFPNNQYTADIKRKDASTNRYKMNIFVSKQFEGILKKTSESSPEWIKLDDLSTYNLLPNVKQAIMDSIKFLKDS